VLFLVCVSSLGWFNRARQRESWREKECVCGREREREKEREREQPTWGNWGLIGIRSTVNPK